MEAARLEREVASSELDDAVRQAEAYLGSTDPSTRFLKQRISKINDKEQRLCDAHYAYLEKAKIPFTDEDSRKFLNAKVDAALNCTDLYAIFIDDKESDAKTADKNAKETEAEAKRTQENATKLARLQHDLALEERFANELVKKLDLIMNDNTTMSNEVMGLVQSYDDKLCETVESLNKSWKECISLTKDEEELKRFTDAVGEMKITFQDAHSRVKAISESFAAKQNRRESSGQDIHHNSDNAVAPRDVHTSNLMVRPEKMKLPSFSGNVQSYAHLKKDFNEIVLPFYSEQSHQVYVLKENCLKGQAKLLVENIEDIGPLWKRLDDKYGDKIDLVDVVFKDLDNLPNLKANEDSKFITMVDTLEKGLLDLEAINAKNEIANAYTVKLMESKISRQLYLTWLKEEEREDKDNTDEQAASNISRFQKMLNFLKEERRRRMKLMKRISETPQPPAQHQQRKQNAYSTIDSTQDKKTQIQRCLIHPNATHFTRQCNAFKSKTAGERAAIVKETNGCHFCLSTDHPGKPCPWIDQWNPCNKTGCGKYHSHLLHDAVGTGLPMAVNASTTSITASPTITATSMTSSTAIPSNNVLLLIQEVATETSHLIAFFDNGSTISLVSKTYVKLNNLKRIRVSYDLTTVGGKCSTQHTYFHNIPLIDTEGIRHVIQAYEINDVCGKLGDVDVTDVIALFPGLSAEQVQRRPGNIELLIGMRHADIHPSCIQEVQGLVLYSSKFGTNRVLGGTHPLLKESDYLDKGAQVIAHAQVRNARVMFNKHLNCGIDFVTAEDFGVKLLLRCERCKNCRDCTFEIHQMSKAEQRELQFIEENLVLNPMMKQWTTAYPYKCDPRVMEDNRAQAISLLEDTEKRIIKSPETCAQYREQFQDLVKRNVFEELTETDIADYKGPVSYVSHHEVYKEDSTSTPVRIVINSSLKYKGRSLNDILMKGPNTLNDLFGVQLRFRSYQHALACDISKMYTMIKTTEMEKHLRRVLFRDADPMQPIKTYGTNVVMFGDRPAAAIATVAIRKTATIYKEINEEAAEKIIRDSYVDDITTGTDDVESQESLKQGIEKILEQGGFKLKEFVMSGNDSDEPLALLGSGELGRVLGMGWDPKSDKFKIKVRVNLSIKTRKGRAGPNLKIEEIPSIVHMKLTKRLLLSFMNSCYEPLGLTSPITVQMKIAMRKLYRMDCQLGWDDDVPNDMKLEWIEVIQRVKESEGITFQGCVRPADTIGNPELIICSDGSEQAMCATAYLRWRRPGGFQCYLWTAKSRVTPLKKLSMPRIEMQSAVMGVRLSDTIKRNSIWKFDNIYHIIDSLCTLATLKKNSSALREFMGNRVAEILDTTEVEQWYHVKSDDNIADLGTHSNALVSDLKETSEWQNERPWMSQPFLEWPVTQDVGKVSIPEDEVIRTKFCGQTNADDSPAISFEKYVGRSYQFVVNLSARLLRIARTKSFRNNTITVEDMQQAEQYMIRSSMKLSEKLMEKGNLNSLRPEGNQEGIIILKSRAVEGLQKHYGTTEFPILSENDPIVHLWLKKIHEEDHGGITKVVAKSRRRFWIIRARKLAKKIIRCCYRCRLQDKIFSQQIMAPLPTSRLVMSPTFNEISIDLFGPFEIKDTVKQRVRKKVWGLVVNCVATRAIHLDLTEDYGADAFLQTFRRFVSLRGCPNVIHCDKGSQLQAAWEDFKNWSTSRQIQLKVTPAEGQHQNGLSESLIKSVKKSLSHAIGNNILSFSRLQMVFFEIVNIINARPIGVTSGSDPTCPEPITSNHLLLGRSTSDVVAGPFINARNVNRRYEFIQQLIEAWWIRWYERVLPSLVPCYKWLQCHCNVKVGDICLIRYKNDIRATYRLGKVIEANPSADGMVRKVLLQYKLPNENTYRYVDRPIHGIAVIVPIEEQVEAKASSNDSQTRVLNPSAEEFRPGSMNNASNPGMYNQQ